MHEHEMSDDDNEKEATLAGVIEANARPWNGYWAWKDKPVGEHGAAHEILTGAGIPFEGLVSRDQGQDPPDCEAKIDGQRVGIEITELVHQRTMERSLRAQRERARGQEPEKEEVYFVWDRAKLLQHLQDRIDAKDRAEPKGGPYSRYFLVIHTDEMFLDAAQVDEWLTGATFRANRITDALLGLSYHPAHNGSPVFRLRLCARDRESQGPYYGDLSAAG
jgi:hypothetical protein